MPFTKGKGKKAEDSDDSDDVWLYWCPVHGIRTPWFSWGAPHYCNADLPRSKSVCRRELLPFKNPDFQRGVVKTWFNDRNFGFIHAVFAGNSQVVYMHREELMDQPRWTPRVGDDMPQPCPLGSR